MNRFEKAVLKRLDGDWRSCQTYFYKIPVGHILCGFTVDSTPNYQFIVRFCQPIFDRVTVLHFSFSQRLTGPGECISRIEKPDEGLATIVASNQPAKALRKLRRSFSPDGFVRGLSPHIAEALSFEQPELFVRAFEPNSRSLPAASSRQYAAVLIMLGRYDDAAEQLRHCLSVERDEAHAKDTTLLLGALTRDPTAAAALLREWEAETKRKFHLL
jgi:hypothetical protein